MKESPPKATRSNIFSRGIQQNLAASGLQLQRLGHWTRVPDTWFPLKLRFYLVWLRVLVRLKNKGQKCSWSEARTSEAGQVFPGRGRQTPEHRKSKQKRGREDLVQDELSWSLSGELLLSGFLVSVLKCFENFHKPDHKSDILIIVYVCRNAAWGDGWFGTIHVNKHLFHKHQTLAQMNSDNEQRYKQLDNTTHVGFSLSAAAGWSFNKHWHTVL